MSDKEHCQTRNITRQGCLGPGCVPHVLLPVGCGVAWLMIQREIPQLPLFFSRKTRVACAGGGNTVYYTNKGYFTRLFHYGTYTLWFSNFSSEYIKYLCTSGRSKRIIGKLSTMFIVRFYLYINFPSGSWGQGGRGASVAQVHRVPASS